MIDGDDVRYFLAVARAGEIRTAEVPLRTTDAAAQIVAVRQGLGMTTLPCFVGDADLLLVRTPGTDLRTHGTLWLLTQGEIRKTKRVRLFTEFISRRLAAYVQLLAGLSYSSTDRRQMAEEGLQVLSPSHAPNPTLRSFAPRC